MNRLFNLGLRVVTLIGKFLLVFSLARSLDPSEVGLYGLLAVTISYFLFIVGLDFYTYSTREILKYKKEEWGKYLKSQIYFFIFMYGMVIPFSLFVFIFEFLPWEVVFWFYLILFLEHFSQEINRFLVVISEQLTASVVLFFRSGLWCFIVIGWMYIDENSRSIKLVLLLWSVGALAGIGIGLYKCHKLKIRGWKDQVDWSWVRRGLKISIPLLVGTLFLRGIYTIDRYWFEILVSREALGAYVLFIGICNALMSFLDAGVFVYSYPSLIKKYNEGDQKGFSKEMWNLTRNVLLISFVFFLASLVFIPLVMTWLDNDLYKKYEYLYWILLISSIVFSISMIPHYGLYSKGNDRPIIISHIFGFLIFFISTFLVSLIDKIIAVPVGLIFSFSFIFLAKYVSYRKY